MEPSEVGLYDVSVALLCCFALHSITFQCEENAKCTCRLCYVDSLDNLLGSFSRWWKVTYLAAWLKAHASYSHFLGISPTLKCCLCLLEKKSFCRNRWQWTLRTFSLWFHPYLRWKGRLTLNYFHQQFSMYFRCVYCTRLC